MVKRFFSMLLLLAVIWGVFVIHASNAEIIGIRNVTNGEVRAGVFELDGVVLDNGRINKVAVKVGLGPWETVYGIEHWSYTVDTRHLVVGYESVVDPASGQLVETPEYGPYYGDLSIVVRAFEDNDAVVAEKVINITVIPEKPYSDICSGIYSEPINVVLKAASEVTAYYTIDGTDPKINGISYTGAIYVDQNTVIKAVTKSKNNQYSEVSSIDIKINHHNPPGFRIQYYEDQTFSRPLPDPAYLKAGTYYLKIISDRKFSSGPFIDIDAPGTNNDANNVNLVPVSDCVYQYTRVVVDDAAAVGDTQEVIKIYGTDNQGNHIQDLIPINSAVKAAYLDTQPPASGNIAVAGGATSTHDPTPELVINSTGADFMRLALSESGLAAAHWIKFTDQYDELNISGGGNGAKTIWIEFQDRAGNIQTQHASVSVLYDNTVLSFDVEYYKDACLIHSLGRDPYLKAGAYYLKITANQDLNYNPALQIDAEGSNNDLPNGLTLMMNPRVFMIERTIVADDAAIGVTREQIAVQGIAPSNGVSNAAYTDTQEPEIPLVSGSETTTVLIPVWSWNTVSDAVKYRYSFSEGTNWVETTATNFTPDENLTSGSTYTLYVQAGDQAGNWSNSGYFATTIVVPGINVKQDMSNIPNGTGSFNYGNVPVLSSKDVIFTIENIGTGDLSLTDPMVTIGGADAACFNVTIQPSSPVAPSGSTTFTVSFTPGGCGNKVATVSITNDDHDNNPYTFIITGTGTAETLDLGTWNPSSIAAGETKIYCFATVPGNTYAITWDALYDGSRTYSCDIVVSAYRLDLTTTYFNQLSAGYSYPKVITAQDNIVFIKVAGCYSFSSGTFALKAALNQPVMTVKQGTTNIPNGSGSFDFGNIPLLTYETGNIASFTVANTGTCNLNLTGSPRLSIGGPDAASFYIVSQPPSQLAVNKSGSFKIKFYPTSIGIKTAVISISNDDPANNPYTFTITGTGTVETLALDTWIEGNIGNSADTKVYCFSATSGKTYAISWDDSFQGTGNYTANIIVDACHEDLEWSYIGDRDSGYLTPMVIKAVQNKVYLKIDALNSASTGSFALKVSEIIPEPVMVVKQGDTVIQSGTGIYDLGNVSVFDSQKVFFTIQNTGINKLILSGSPVVEKIGDLFAAIIQPAVTVLEPNQSTTFQVIVTAYEIGERSATIRIKNNDSDQNPYTFTVTATGYAEMLNFGVWTPGSLPYHDDIRTYCFQSFPWNKYAISWDDRDNPSGSYTADIKVSAYWGWNMASVYFKDYDSGYNYPVIITAMDGMVYLKVEDNSSWGETFAIRVTEIDPTINVKQGTTNISNGTGSYDFGHVAPGSSSNDIVFTIENTGGSRLNLTGTPLVGLNGPDSGCFNIITQPASSVAPDGSTTFKARFNPVEAGTKTATISIPNNDQDKNPYTFTITGTGSTSGNTLTLGNWTQGAISTAGEVKTYSFNTTPGVSYAIAWDDSYQGSGAYSCDIKVSAYLQNQTTAYFSNADSGYTAPRTIVAQDNIVYIKVAGYSVSSTGGFALKAAISKPEMNVKQGANDIPNGSGSFNFGNVSFGASSNATFTVQNNGNRSLNLTGTPKVQINGVDAAVFSIYAQPSSPVALNGSATFVVKFSPIGTGTKIATISIASDDPDKNPYTFTVIGTGANIVAETLALNTWTQGNIDASGDVKVYCFSTIPGKSYMIYWDDSYQGSSTYSCDIKVSAYRLNFSTAYFSSIDSGYTTPKTITAQETMVYIKVEGYSSNSTGSYALKVVEVN